jgi:hypothetical protein
LVLNRLIIHSKEKRHIFSHLDDEKAYLLLLDAGPKGAAAETRSMHTDSKDV